MFNEDNENQEKFNLLIDTLKENQSLRRINLGANAKLFNENSNLNKIFQSNKNIIDIGVNDFGNKIGKNNEYLILNNKLFQSQRSNFIEILAILSRL